jgi:hypothetical protein
LSFALSSEDFLFWFALSCLSLLTLFTLSSPFLYAVTFLQCFLSQWMISTCSLLKWKNQLK